MTQFQSETPRSLRSSVLARAILITLLILLAVGLLWTLGRTGQAGAMTFMALPERYSAFGRLILGAMLALLGFGLLGTVRTLRTVFVQDADIARARVVCAEAFDGEADSPLLDDLVVKVRPGQLRRDLTRLRTIRRRGVKVSPDLIEEVVAGGGRSTEAAPRFSGALLLLGLLGTFVGLQQTVGDLRSVMQNTGTATDALAAFSGAFESIALAFGTSLWGIIGVLLNRAWGGLAEFASAELAHRVRELHLDLLALIGSRELPEVGSELAESLARTSEDLRDLLGELQALGEDVRLDEARLSLFASEFGDATSRLTESQGDLGNRVLEITAILPRLADAQSSLEDALGVFLDDVVKQNLASAEVVASGREQLAAALKAQLEIVGKHVNASVNGMNKLVEGQRERGEAFLARVLDELNGMAAYNEDILARGASLASALGDGLSTVVEELGETRTTQNKAVDALTELARRHGEDGEAWRGLLAEVKEATTESARSQEQTNRCLAAAIATLEEISKHSAAVADGSGELAKATKAFAATAGEHLHALTQSRAGLHEETLSELQRVTERLEFLAQAAPHNRPRGIWGFFSRWQK